MTDRVRVQCECSGVRVWVAAPKEASIRELMAQCAAAVEKQTGHAAVISGLSLRGALLDPDEKVQDWLSDQEMIFAESALPAGAGDEKGLAAGILVAHEPPLNSENLKLGSLEPQMVIIGVMGAPNVGKKSFVRSFGGKATGMSVEKKVEVDGVTHKVVLSADEGDGELLKKANAFLFLYDCTDRSTYQALQAKMLGEFVAARGHELAVPVAICSNKSDLSQKRKVSAAEAIQLAKELQTLCKGSVAVFETSATSNTTKPPVSDSLLNVLQYRCQKFSAEAEEDGGCVIV